VANVSLVADPLAPRLAPTPYLAVLPDPLAPADPVPPADPVVPADPLPSHGLHINDFSFRRLADTATQVGVSRIIV
jgi:hypothetical protein